MAHSHSITENPGQLIGVTLLAATVGAAVATVLAPKSGAETRALIKDSAAKAKSKMKTTKEDVADKAKETTEQVKDKVKKVDADGGPDDIKQVVKKTWSEK
ncbi:MAG: YtxH-like protein [Candidatus Saccharibacteria bacterium]|nr:YtxH-like protein [Candidatus Saccharibacteria bacterium]